MPEVTPHNTIRPVPGLTVSPEGCKVRTVTAPVFMRLSVPDPKDRTRVLNDVLDTSPTVTVYPARSKLPPLYISVLVAPINRLLASVRVAPP